MLMLPIKLTKAMPSSPTEVEGTPGLVKPMGQLSEDDPRLTAERSLEMTRWAALEVTASNEVSSTEQE